MRMAIASSDVWKLVALAGIGLGIMWALQALGFGPTWIIGAAIGGGVSAGAVYVAAALRDEAEDEAGFPMASVR